MFITSIRVFIVRLHILYCVFASIVSILCHILCHILFGPLCCLCSLKNLMYYVMVFFFISRLVLSIIVDFLYYCRYIVSYINMSVFIMWIIVLMFNKILIVLCYICTCSIFIRICFAFFLLSWSDYCLLSFLIDT